MAASAVLRTLTIGSRGSQLALWQAQYVARSLQDLGVRTEIRVVKTTGDHLQTASLVQAGGKGLFTKEIEEALLAGEIDLAVHSLKDLPTENPPGLTIAAIPERQDPRDALVGTPLPELPLGARVGTSSNRRAAQLRMLRPDLRILPVRGNVDTRIRKLREGQFEALLLAAAGLRRLGLEHEIAYTFPVEEMCPAPGQGALAIQVRSADEAETVCAELNHADSAWAVECERSVLAELGGGCQLPVAAFAMPSSNGRLHAIAGVFAPDGSRCIRAEGTADRGSARELGRSLAVRLMADGAKSILTLAKE